MADVRGLNHVSIAVRDLDRAVELYRDRIGLEVREQEEIAERGVRLAKLYAGEVCIELVQPLSEDSPLGRSIARRGEGLHHLAFTVGNLDAMLAELRERGVPLVDETPKRGAGGSRIAFLRPEALAGVLVELVEPGESDSAAHS
jgi:methylmalonyl-CoA/ethylmalonyl-CoA epimerase